MCGGGPNLPPQTDPKVERQAAEAEATRAANGKAAEARRSMRQQSLLASGAGGAVGTPVTSTVLAQGKPKLGS
jgi:ubiquitin